MSRTQLFVVSLLSLTLPCFAAAASYSAQQSGNWNDRNTWGASGNTPGYLANPFGVATDSDGNIYVADSNGARITILNSQGIAIHEFTGNGLLQTPFDVAVDTTGHIYVADIGLEAVVVLNPDGSVAHKYGEGTISAADGGVAVDSSGNIYVGDQGNSNDILVMDSSGTVIHTFNAGGTLNCITGVAVDQSNNIYVSDNCNDAVTKMDSSGTVLDTFDGGGDITDPEAVALDQSGHIYIGNSANNEVLVLNPDGSVAHTFDGSPSQFNNPNRISVDSSGNIYVSEYDGQRISVLAPDGTIQKSFYGGGNGLGFNYPSLMSSDSSGNVYVADFSNNRIDKLNSEGKVIALYTAADGLPFLNPIGVTIDASGKMYIADLGNNRVVILNADGSVAHILTGDSTPFSSPEDVIIDGSGKLYISDGGNNRIVVFNADYTPDTVFDASGALSTPQGMTFGEDGKLYIADTNNSDIVVLNTDGSVADTLTGLAYPDAVAFGENGNLYIGNGNGSVIVMQTDGTILQALTAGGAMGTPLGVLFDASGHLIVSDDHQHILTIDPDTDTLLSTWDGTQGYGTAGIEFPGENDNVQGNGYQLTLTQDEKVHSITLNNEATLKLSGHNLSVYGNWNNPPDGTLDPGGGTVTFAGNTTQNISGDTTFYNLVKSALSSILRFAPLSTTAVSNSLTIGAGSTIDVNSGATVPDYVTSWGAKLDPSLSANFVALDGTDHIYITDSPRRRIVEMNRDGSFVYSFTGGSSLSTNLGKVAIDTEGNVYVPDFSNGDVVVLRPDDSVAHTFTAGNTLVDPLAVALDAQNNIYILDGGAPAIVVLDSSGSVLHTFTAGGALNNPNDVTVDTSGKIYIANSAGNSIIVLNPDGTTAHTFTAGGSLTRPAGVAVDSSGKIYVTELDDDDVVILNPDGTVADTFDGNGELSGPGTVGVDSNGKIYIANGFSTDLVVLNSDGTTHVVITRVSSPLGPTFIGLNGITRASNGDLYVSDCGDFGRASGDKIQRLSAVDGSYISTLASYGSGKGEVKCPGGLLTDPEGNLYVADGSNGRIDKFDSNGNFLFMFGWGVRTGANEFEICTAQDSSCQAGIQGSDKGQFADPGGAGPYSALALDPDGNLFFNDYENNRVDKFDSNGNFLLTFGEGVRTGANEFEICTADDSNCQSGNYDAGPGDIDYPNGLGVTSSGIVYVADNSNNRVDTYDTDGNFLLSFGWGVQTGTSQFETCTTETGCRSGISGDGEGQFSSTESIGIDSQGNIFTYDGSNDRIEKFDSNNNFLTSWDSFDNNSRSFDFVNALLLAPDNTLYAADTGVGKVYTFSPAADSYFTLSPGSVVAPSGISVGHSRNTGDTITCTDCTDLGGNEGWNFVTTSSSPPPPTHHSHGGGSSVAYLQKYFPGTLPLGTPTSTPNVTQAPKQLFPPTLILKLGMTSPYVKVLQQFLNAHGFPVSLAGPGAKGSETSLFGAKTKAALIKFQEANAIRILTPLGLTRGTGILGPATIAFINSL